MVVPAMVETTPGGKTTTGAGLVNTLYNAPLVTASTTQLVAGKAALHELLSVWMARLAPGTSAWLVVNRHLGGDSLAAWLVERGWEVRRAASKSGYRVLEVTR